MITDVSALENQYLQFIEKAIEQQKVWTIVSDDDMPLFQSQQYDDLLAMPFFSNLDAALIMTAEEEWKDFEIDEVPLEDFLESWLIGLYTQDVQVAAIWNEELMGREFEPLELAIAFIEELKKANIDLEFEKFESVDQLFEEIKNTLAD